MEEINYVHCFRTGQMKEEIQSP